MRLCGLCATLLLSLPAAACGQPPSSPSPAAPAAATDSAAAAAGPSASEEGQEGRLIRLLRGPAGSIPMDRNSCAKRRFSGDRSNVFA